MKSNLLAYALDASSFIMQKIRNKEDIKHIILFGSVSREEAGAKSDVDIFIDVVNKSRLFEKELHSSLGAFYKSIKYTQYWKLLGVTNEIKLTIGKIEEWKELQPSIAANGIVLYGKYAPYLKEGTHKTFLIWENVQPNAKRVLFNKRIFGFKQRGKTYAGLLSKYTGERLGKGCILVPAEHAQLFITFFRKNNITVKIKRVLEYG